MERTLRPCLEEDRPPPEPPGAETIKGPECPDKLICYRLPDAAEIGAYVEAVQTWMAQAWLACGPQWEELPHAQE